MLEVGAENLATIWLPKIEKDASGSQNDTKRRKRKSVAAQRLSTLCETIKNGKNATRNEKVACSSQVTSSNKTAVFSWKRRFLYKGNHSLYEWFKKAYGDEQKCPAMITEWLTNNAIVHNKDS